MSRFSDFPWYSKQTMSMGIDYTDLLSDVKERKVTQVKVIDLRPFWKFFWYKVDLQDTPCLIHNAATHTLPSVSAPNMQKTANLAVSSIGYLA